MSTPLISCVVPVYNAERFIAEALDSIWQQTYRPLEVIVVNDGSSDGTEAVLDQFHDRIVRVSRANGGPAAARNTGLALARGEFIAFLDADDLWHPEKLQRQMVRFDARPELGLSLTFKRQFWEPEMQDEEARLRAEGHPIVADHPGFVCQTMLMRRATFDRVGSFNERLRTGEDTEWLSRASACGVVREVLKDVLVFRRMHQNNLSYSRYTPRGVQDQLELVRLRLAQRRSSAP